MKISKQKTIEETILERCQHAPFVKSTYKCVGSVELDEEIKKELLIPDPPLNSKE